MTRSVPAGFDVASAIPRRRTLAPGVADPGAALFGMRIVAAGCAAFAPAEFHYNPLGTVHGGVIATVLDMAMADAVRLAVSANRIATRLEIKVNYLAGLTEAAGEVSAQACVVQAGRRIAAATARLVDGAGRLYATASATFLVAETPDPRPLASVAGDPWETTWFEPRSLSRAGSTMGGLEFLQAMGAGVLPPPPVLSLLGIGMGEVAPGRVTMTLPSNWHLCDPHGHVHGGMIATLLDSVMGCAVNSTLPQGLGYTTVEIRVNFVRAITAADGAVLGVGRVVHTGRQVAIAEATATDAAGAVCAIASTTCLVFDARRRA